MKLHKYLEYLATTGGDFARGWVQRGRAERHGVFVAFDYVDIVGGNMYDAILFAQIMYYADLNMDKRESRMTHIRDDHLWIVKTYTDWAKELHLNSEHTIRNIMKRLEEKELIIKEMHKSPFHDNNIATFVRPNWLKLEEKLMKIPGTTYQVDPGSTQEVDSETTYQIDPIYTESTTENTTEKIERIVPIPSSIPLAQDHSVDTEIIDTSGNEPKKTDRFGLDHPDTPRIGVLIAKRFDRNYLTRGQIEKLAKIEAETRGQTEKRLTLFLDDLEASLKKHSKGRTVNNMVERASMLNMNFYGWYAWDREHPGGGGVSPVLPPRPVEPDTELTEEDATEALRQFGYQIQQRLGKRKKKGGRNTDE